LFYFCKSYYYNLNRDQGFENELNLLRMACMGRDGNERTRRAVVSVFVVAVAGILTIEVTWFCRLYGWIAGCYGGVLEPVHGLKRFVLGRNRDGLATHASGLAARSPDFDSTRRANTFSGVSRVVANPRHSRVMGAVCALHLHPKKASGQTF
jgi:hypothetical protein